MVDYFNGGSWLWQRQAGDGNRVRVNMMMTEKAMLTMMAVLVGAEGDDV